MENETNRSLKTTAKIRRKKTQPRTHKKNVPESRNPQQCITGCWSEKDCGNHLKQKRGHALAAFSLKRRYALALDIKPTPKLDKKDSEKFIERVEAKASVASHPIPTPKIVRLTKKIIKDVTPVSQK